MSIDVPRAPFLDVRSFVAGETGPDQDAFEVSAAPARPFLSLYESDDGDGVVNPEAEEFGSFLNELYDPEFDEALFELVGEAAALHESRLGHEVGGDEGTGPEAERLLAQHFAPLVGEAEAMIGRLAAEFGGRPAAELTDGEVDAVVDRYQPAGDLSPSFENFLGRLKKAVGKVAKKAVSLAKKGVGAAVALGLGPVLSKLRTLVQPLLKKVLQAAINRLPAQLQPIARTLAERLSLLPKAAAPKPAPPPAPAATAEPADATPAGTGPAAPADAAADPGGAAPADTTATSDNAAAADPGDIQQEFHEQAASLLFAANDVEQELEVARVLTQARAPVGDPLGELDRARARFVDGLQQLHEGEDTAPLVEGFIPAVLPVLRVGIRLAGRKRVIGFLAPLVAKLIQRFVGPQHAPALSQAIVDAGLRLVSLEAAPEDEAGVAGDAVAATVEEAVRRVASLPDYVLDDPELLEGFALEAVEQAAAGNLPPALSGAVYRTRPDLLEAPSLRGTWVPMPLRGRRKRYKKYSRVARARLTPHVASAVASFGGARLSEALEEQFGLPPGEDVEARVHLYEAVPGTLLSELAQLEHDTPGLGTADAYGQLHPLTPDAAGLLLDEPRLGREVGPRYLAGPYTADVGQRFYFLEIPGRRPLMTPGPGGGGRPRRRSRVGLTLDFRGDQLRVHLHLSEVRAQELAVKLRQRAHLGAVVAHLGRRLGPAIRRALTQGAGSVRVIHDAVPPKGWPGALQRLPSLALRVLAGRIQEWVLRGLADHFRQSPQDFVAASEDPADGVTIAVVVTAPPGFARLGQALRGRGLALDGLKLFDGAPAVSVRITPRAAAHE